MNHDWIALRTRVYQCSRCGMVIALPPGRLEPPQAECRGEPGMFARVFNYAGALRRWISAGRPIRDTQEQQRILTICRSCDRYDAQRFICRECGCHLVSGSILLSKIAWATEHCPLEKW